MHCHRLRYEAARSLSRVTPARRPTPFLHNVSLQILSRPASLAASPGVAGWDSDSSPRLWDGYSFNEARDARAEQPPNFEQRETGLPEVFDEEEESAQFSLGAPERARESAADLVIAQGKYETVKEAQDAVVKALLNKSAPENVLFTFFRASQHPEFLPSISEVFLQRVLDAVRPENLLLPYRHLHQDMHPSALRAYRLQSLGRIFAVYHEIVDMVLTQVQYTRRKPYPWAFKALLNLARVTGSVKHAKSVFKQLEMIPGYHLEVEDYNHFFEALCWDSAYTTERFALRVTPASLARRNTQGGRRNEGYRTGNSGIKDQVLQRFGEMQQAGLHPDATTFTHLMTAFGREGQMEDVKIIIKKAWDIDCDRVLQHADQEMLLENTLDPSHPMYPTADTLHAVAHVFSINNNMSAALQVVDFFARKYDIPFSRRIWTELLSWAYVLSTRRRGAVTERKVDAKAGQLPLSTVMQLWQIMQSPPYEVRPTMSMLGYLIRTCFRRDAKAEMVRVMLEANELSLASRRRWEVSKGKKVGLENGGRLIDDLARLEKLRDHGSMTRFLRLLLAGTDEKRARGWRPEIRHIWFTQTIPDIISHFWIYRPPAGAAYDIPTGRVQFHPRQETSISTKSTQNIVDGLTIEQHPGPADLGTYLGFTRQQRLQYRHSRHQDEWGRPPRWTPAYHEIDDVADWAEGRAKAIHQRTSSQSRKEASASGDNFTQLGTSRSSLKSEE